MVGLGVWFSVGSGVKMAHMAHMEEVDVVESEVMMFLSALDANGLEEVCHLISVPCQDPVKGKKNSLLKLLFKYLLDIESIEDQGFATFQILHKHFVPNAPKPGLKTERETEINSKSQTEALKKSKTVFDVEK